MMTSQFKIEGMTCQSCVAKVTTELQKLPSVESVVVDLNDKLATLKSKDRITLLAVQNSLSRFSKYSVLNFAENDAKSNLSPTDELVVSKFITYKPLIILFSYVFLVSVAYQFYHKHLDINLFMNHIMAGFFIGLSFFKFLNLTAFAESFAGYDPIARNWTSYGLIYPFIELGLGLLFISETYLLIANVVTVFILASTTIGVISKLQKKSKLVCACAGAGFNLPLSGVTVLENAVMIAMALLNLRIL